MQRHRQTRSSAGINAASLVQNPQRSPLNRRGRTGLILRYSRMRVGAEPPTSQREREQMLTPRGLRLPLAR